MPAVAQFVFYVLKIHTRVEVARIKVATPSKCTVISDLKNPEARWSARRIKQTALALDQYKNVLEKVIRFCCITQNAICDSPDGMSIAAKQARERIAVTLADTEH